MAKEKTDRTSAPDLNQQSQFQNLVEEAIEKCVEDENIVDQVKLSLLQKILQQLVKTERKNAERNSDISKAVGTTGGSVETAEGLMVAQVIVKKQVLKFIAKKNELEKFPPNDDQILKEFNRLCKVNNVAPKTRDLWFLTLSEKFQEKIPKLRYNMKQWLQNSIGPYMSTEFLDQDIVNIHDLPAKNDLWNPIFNVMNHIFLGGSSDDEEVPDVSGVFCMEQRIWFKSIWLNLRSNLNDDPTILAGFKLYTNADIQVKQLVIQNGNEVTIQEVENTYVLPNESPYKKPDIDAKDLKEEKTKAAKKLIVRKKSTPTKSTPASKKSTPTKSTQKKLTPTKSTQKKSAPIKSTPKKSTQKKSLKEKSKKITVSTIDPSDMIIVSDSDSENEISKKFTLKKFTPKKFTSKKVNSKKVNSKKVNSKKVIPKKVNSKKVVQKKSSSASKTQRENLKKQLLALGDSSSDSEDFLAEETFTLPAKKKRNLSQLSSFEQQGSKKKQKDSQLDNIFTTSRSCESIDQSSDPEATEPYDSSSESD